MNYTNLNNQTVPPCNHPNPVSLHPISSPCSLIFQVTKRFTPLPISSHSPRVRLLKGNGQKQWSQSETRVAPNSFFSNSLLCQRNHVLVSDMSQVLEPDINQICISSPLLIICDLTFMKFSFLICTIIVQNGYICCEYKNEVSYMKAPRRVTDRFASDQDYLSHQTLARFC